MAFKWLSEPRFTDTINEKKPVPEAYEHIKRLVVSLEKIKTLLEKNFPEGSPFPSTLHSTAKKWETATKPKIQTPAPTAPGPQSAATTAGSSPAPAAQQTAQASSAQTETIESPKDAQALCKKLALLLIEKEPEKPLGYRLLRSLRWEAVEKAPVVEEGKTKLDPPAPEKKTFLQNLIAKQEWKNVILTAEKTFGSATFHFWLDLQKICSDACKKLEGPYKAVHNAICIETALFIKRIPEVMDLRFSDSSPFCEESTKNWIHSEVLTAVASSDGSSLKKQAVMSDDLLAAEKNESDQLVAAGKVEAAVELLQGKMQSSGNERTNFRRAILLCSLLLGAKRPEIALAILESLNDKIALYNLDKWEPDLAIEAWGLLVRTYRVTSANKPQNIQIAIQEKQNIILSKISCINPGIAMKLKI